MKTTSVLFQTLCVPCRDLCRHCLLSWDGTAVGADWDRSVRLAERFLRELQEQRPEISASFSFGYSMEHPDLREALRTLRRLGSPQAEFLQCDGMKMRDEAGCRELTALLLSEGVRQLNFTVYGLSASHDRFAGRKGDYELIGRMMKAAGECGLPFTSGIPLTTENIAETDELASVLRHAGAGKVFLFIPHEEGRGRNLSGIRIGASDLLRLSPETRTLLNRTVYRPESEWLQEPDPVREQNRMILISLRADNIGEYEKRGAEEVVREIEALDEQYYSAFPSFEKLAALYGDPGSDKLYRIRDLYYHYRLLYAQDHNISVYDVTDERQSGSRRY